MQRPNSLALFYVTAAVLSCRGTTVRDAPPSVHLTAPDLAGTYALRICRGVCSPQDTTLDLRRGVLVLTEQPIDLTGQPDSVQSSLEDFHDPPVNACYVLRALRDDPSTYALLAVGGTRWRLDSTGTRVSFDLYASVDAGYEVTAMGSATGLRGRGHSWGVGLAAVDYPHDSVVATRLDAPDPSVCFAAVGPALAAMMR